MTDETYEQAIDAAEFWSEDNGDIIDFGEADCND
jgi:hypothetical protein